MTSTSSSSVNNGNFPTNLPVLNGKNYDRWIVQMRVIFRYQDVLEVVTQGVSELEKGETEAQKLTHRDLIKKDCKALFLIHQCVDNEIFEKIVQSETSKDAWDTLEKAYAGDEKLKKVKLQTLRRQYELLSMSEQESVAEYLNRLVTLTNQMRANGETIIDQMKVEKVLRTMTQIKYKVTAVLHGFEVGFSVF